MQRMLFFLFNIFAVMILQTACSRGNAYLVYSSSDTSHDASAPSPSFSPVPHPTQTPITSPALGPTHGSGGVWNAGSAGRSPNGAYIYIPKKYKESIASPVIFLFHVQFQLLQSFADSENIILVDTEPLDRGDTTNCNGGRSYPSGYVNQPFILNLIAESRNILISKYNIDLSRVYYFGWSHGGDLALKFGSLPTAGTPAPDDSNDLACTSSPDVLLPLQLAAHSGQNEVAGVMVFPGHYGYEQIDQWNAVNRMGTRHSCFAYSVGDQDSTYTQAYDILIPQLKGVSNFQNRVYFKIWTGWGHDLVPNTAAVQSAWDWIKSCNSVSN